MTIVETQLHERFDALFAKLLRENEQAAQEITQRMEEAKKKRKDTLQQLQEVERQAQEAYDTKKDSVNRVSLPVNVKKFQYHCK